ncbi:MAG TPA: DNA-deoxyinosine glycosylase [Rectinemataceae bacterium]|nr:DNA-deoxyinosine glycosylase [Rectinemataceae bacterium]
MAEPEGDSTPPSNPRLRGLPPLDTAGATILVLGSFPSVRSLEKGEYYGHPRNHFWPLMAAIEDASEWHGEDNDFASSLRPPTEWEGRKALAARLGLSIWDLVDSCERRGSLDADIREAVVNDIPGFVASRPRIDSIALNGSLAAALFEFHFARGSRFATGPIGKAVNLELAGRLLVVRRLPSTSPVPTRRFRKAIDKLPCWMEACALP